jgi:hypothetical protein
MFDLFCYQHQKRKLSGLLSMKAILSPPCLRKFVLVLSIVIVFPLLVFSTVVSAEELPYYLKDRGTGIPTSMFGTYINKGEIIIYPFYEFYYDKDMEYSPEEMGYTGDIDYTGKYVAHEGLIYLAYGITDWLMIEGEAAVITAKLEKSENDTSDMPDSIEESGLGDVEGQLRWRYFRETEYRPELFSYFETVFPVQDDEVLIGTTDWEFKFGVGIIKGFRFGTITLRAAVEHDKAEGVTELGEYAVEYLKRLSDHFRIFLGVEGSQDEVELITELQWHINENVCVVFNNAFGITPKAEDYAPEFGIMFKF